MNRVILLLTLLWQLIVFAGAQDSLPENVARIHYQRPDGIYDGFELHVWEDTTDSVTWASGLKIAGTTDYGVYWDVNLAEGAERVGFIVHRGDEKDPGPDMFLLLGVHGREIWLKSGSDTIYTHRPLAPPAEGTARIHYYRPDGDYAGFELHLWEDTLEQVTWAQGLPISGESDYGVYWELRLRENARRVGFIVHRGDEKDPGPDMFLELETHGNEIWLISGSTTIHRSRPELRTMPTGDLGRAQAHWLSPTEIAWRVGTLLPGTRFYLHAAADGVLELAEGAVVGGERIALHYRAEQLPAALAARLPHLADYALLTLEEADAARVPELLRGRVAVSMVHGERLLDATGLQIPQVLDALYAEAATAAQLGVSWQGGTPTLQLWAPTARRVRLKLFDSATAETHQTFEMVRDAASGIWELTGSAEWYGRYYLYEVTVYAPSTQRLETNLVTDPYSVSLAQNSTRSQLIDLDDPALKPAGWDALVKPPLPAPEHKVIYELHLRDFSMSDPAVPEAHRGTYLAFTHPESYGMRHLRALAEAGLTHVHLLPTFDIATINEDRSTWQDPGDLSRFAPDSAEQQAAIDAIRDQDGFNWGYDPLHFNVPEGSYATEPQGSARIYQYRQMVMALAEAGLYLAKDVVYNHTNASGQHPNSVLDRIVPGYYHRLNRDGFVETSTCCPNTATEHAMMRKLMVDSVVLWATAYKVDAFRFDLMGHHMVADMLAVREALDALTVAAHGTDGRGIYLYGEGWDFGEVANNARGINATQHNLAGTGIGTFSDRLRDAVRGGGPFDDGAALLANQGFINGSYFLPNPAVRLSPEAQRDRLLAQADLIRLGLAGNLADFTFIGRHGELVSGRELDYNGQPAGYTHDPQEQIVYISKHDNQTLWDISQYKIPREVPLSDRVRMHNVGMSLVMLSQGIPFIQAGDELLRSKSFDRNSYNSGDWFNRLDFTRTHNNFGVGLPPAAYNRSAWQYMRPLLADARLVPGYDEISAAVAHFETLLRLRASSELFRLGSAEETQARLRFYNTGPEQIPGVIVMALSDRVEGFPARDPNYQLMVVVFNATQRRQNLRLPELADVRLSLHPLLRDSGDPVVTTATHYLTSGVLSVPAFTTAVFVLPEQ
jgi:pullulanase